MSPSGSSSGCLLVCCTCEGPIECKTFQCSCCLGIFTDIVRHVVEQYSDASLVTCISMPHGGQVGAGPEAGEEGDGGATGSRCYTDTNMKPFTCNHCAVLALSSGSLTAASLCHLSTLKSNLSSTSVFKFIGAMTGWIYGAARRGGLHSQSDGGLNPGRSGPQSQGLVCQVDA